MEAAGLGLFMMSACAWATVLFHPASPVTIWVASGTARRILMGLTMGLTAISLIYSPWGRRSGAHLNPAVTLTFFRLGKVAPFDAVAYIAAQFAGGLAGVIVMVAVMGPLLADPSVHFFVTVPGPRGTATAFVTEASMSAGMMTLVLLVSNAPRFARWTGAGAGLLVATYISTLGPLSGMSMNPARTTASAVPSGIWTAWWVYAVAPPLGMLLAAEAYLRLRGSSTVHCAKLDHAPGVRCIFCEHQQRRATPSTHDDRNREAIPASKTSDVLA